MAAIRGKDTKPEIVVRGILHRMGYRYRLHSKTLPGKPDIVFSGPRKVIFVHGCFWHMHSCAYGKVVPATNRDFWHTKRTGNVERDKNTLDALEHAGWKVFVVWECSLREPDDLLKALRAFLEK
jgi:DNA mismatch endonuclease, patch repair protein